MTYVAVFLGCMIATVLFLFLLDLHPCGRTYGNLVRCRALVGRRGHDFHVWEVIPGVPLRLYDTDAFFERNRIAIMAEERIAMTVRRPEDLVRMTTC